MNDDLETLRARCARLRAALAGVVLGEDAAKAICDDEYGEMIKQVRDLQPQDVRSPLGVAPRELAAALEVLRETAEGKEESHD